jgi:ankyrin repeat protein
VHFVTGKGVDVNSRDPERRWGTALHFAAIYGREDAVETLLNLGADPSLLDNTRSTALHFAAESGARSTCGILLSAGSEVDAQDDDGMTALHRAASMSQATSIGDIHGTCKLLLKHGARIGARDDREYTALHAASEHNNAQVVRELLVAGADPSAIDGLNETALDKAQEVGAAALSIEICSSSYAGIVFCCLTGAVVLACATTYADCLNRATCC